MVFITDFYAFLASVVLISLSGVLLPGPLFAVTLKEATKSKNSGVLIALGHGVVEFPLMLVIFFLLSEFKVSWSLQTGISLVGGLLMIYMGAQTIKHRNINKEYGGPHNDSFVQGIRTTAANPAFILWWLTIGTTLIMNAKLFGVFGFSVFAGLHWSCDFLWYSLFAFLIFRSYRYWNLHIHQGITFFCAAVLLSYGAWFFGSALMQIITMFT